MKQNYLIKTMLVLIATVLFCTKMQAQEPYAVLSDDNTVLTFYYDDQKAARNGISVNRGWMDWSPVIKSVVFDDSFANCTTITSTAYWLSGCTNLTEITGLKNLKTDNVTNMGSMFSDCSSLTSIDVSNFNTANVTNMDWMFSNCSSLTSLDVSNFNTSIVTSMNGIFNKCSSLTSLNVSNFNTSNVKVMSYMFDGCSSLTSLDVSNFNTANVTNMSRMFNRCSSLTSLDVSNFNTANVTNMSFMFGFLFLKSLDLSNFNTPNVKDMNYMFCGCSSLKSLDVSNFNTANVTNMGYMFQNCSSLTSLDLSNFNTAKVRGMQTMFYGCTNLTSLDVSNFNTANVTDMSLMFYGCSSLTSLDLSNFNTPNVKDMNYMFYDCSSLTSIDLSNFNTANVTDMNSMFYNCSSLTSLDLSNFNTAKVRGMQTMFHDCTNLTTIYISNWDTSNVTSTTYTSGMFLYCRNLVGGAGTTYNGSKTNHTYARIDGGSSAPGYFTDKATGRVLNETLDNSSQLTATDGNNIKITLTRTLKAGAWNTFVVPMDIDAATLSTMGITAKQLKSSSVNDKTLTMTFEDATSIEAGKPYLVKVASDIVNPVFTGTVSKTPVITETDCVDFVPTLGLTSVTADAKDVLFLAAANNLYRPTSTPVDIYGFRAYFVLKDNVTRANSFVLDIDGEVTGINTTLSDNVDMMSNETVNDLQGRRVVNPAKGLYIVNGRKVVIK